MSEDELERIKLEDGVQAHENVKLKLIDYAERTGEPPWCTPFMLVVAQDTTHAEEHSPASSSPTTFSADVTRAV